MITPIEFICMDCLGMVTGGIWDGTGLHCWRCWNNAHQAGDCTSTAHAHMGEEVA